MSRALPPFIIEHWLKMASLILCGLTLWTQPACAVDVVLISDNLRVMNLTTNVSRLSDTHAEFAIQNTANTPIQFDLHLRERDIFAQMIFGAPPPKDERIALRLIDSDDGETRAHPDFAYILPMALGIGETKRFFLIGDIPQRTDYWLWDRAYYEQIETRRHLFRSALLVFIIGFALPCVPIAFYWRRVRLLLPPLIALSFALIFYLRWHMEGGVLLRLVVLATLLFMVFAHRALLRLPWTERRYWRSVALLADLLLLLALFGWIWAFIEPGFLGVITADWLEALMAFVPISLCLAVILYLRFRKTGSS